MPTLTDMHPIQSFHRRRFRWRGAMGVVVLAPPAAISLFSRPLIAPASWLLVVVESAAWVAFLAGAAFRFWATLYVGGRKERELVTDGPYSLCRHPLYLGSLLIGVSAGLFLESPLFLAALLVVGNFYLQGTVRVEEAALRARHTDRFDAYVSRVPRLLPRTVTVRTPSEITVDVHRLWLECARASRWIWVPVLGITLSHLRTLVWWPHLFRIH